MLLNHGFSPPNVAPSKGEFGVLALKFYFDVNINPSSAADVYFKSKIT